jgi:hypothetical protein
MSSLVTLKLKVASDSSFTNLEAKAREVIGSKAENLALIAWWDSVHKTGGPREACADETIACVTSYATGHHSSYRVSVNDGHYELFYGTPSGDFAELDPKLVDEVHRDTKGGAFDNVQGG